MNSPIFAARYRRLAVGLASIGPRIGQGTAQSSCRGYRETPRRGKNTSLSIRGDHMKNEPILFALWAIAISPKFRFNTDILATNPINLSVVLGVLIFLERKCVRKDLEYYSKFVRIAWAIEQLEKARSLLKSRNRPSNFESEWISRDRTRKIEID
ncbi:hypothetical protein H5410_035124 [Solanum commersonii]|uniref:Uncharacterized protein n=1 Tax=Solanum commersonii TaxID=4109 RepID=A0A9J5Y3P7_SOLCO|nr:hypothetical protein H5410_035124 [Solanum commersonii]